MYQDDMIDENDGCGGMKQQNKSRFNQRPNTRPQRPQRLTSVDDFIARNERRKERDNFLLYQSHQYEEKKVEEEPKPKPTKPKQPQPEHVVHTVMKQLTAPKIVQVGKVIPWRKNSTRTIATGGAPAYYGVYIHEICVEETTLAIKLMALGEWNLPAPRKCLFCVLSQDTNEDWDGLATEEYELSKDHKYYPTRFDRATSWHPTVESKGYYEGTLVIRKSFLATSLKQHASRATLVMRYGATAPWQNEYAVVKLLEFTPPAQQHVITSASAATNFIGIDYQCPRSKHPIKVEEAWRAVFPQAVLERFRTREQTRS